MQLLPKTLCKLKLLTLPVDNVNKTVNNLQIQGFTMWTTFDL